MGLNTLTGGAFQDFEGNPLVNGYLIFELSHDEQETATSPSGQVVGGLKKQIQLDANGNAAVGSQVWSNDVMVPAGSYYIVNAYRANGATAWLSRQFWTIPSSPSPFDLGTLTPINPPGQGLLSAGSLTLQTNEVNNGSQALLDLHAGPNVTLTNNGGRVTIAAGGGASASFMLGAGRFDLTGLLGASQQNFIDQALRVGVCKFNAPFSVSAFNHIDFYARSGVGGGSNVEVGIYDSTGTQVWNSGSFNVANTASFTAYSIATPSLSFSPGTFFLAWTADTVNLSIFGWDLSTVSFSNGTSEGNIINQNAVSFGYAGNAATAGPTLPATLGTLNPYLLTNNFGNPAIFFQHV